MELRDVADRLGATEQRGDPSTVVRSVAHDSRRGVAGALFCCVPGQRADGHDFAPAAVANGAAALLVERWLELDVPQLRVDSVRAAMGQAAAAVYGDPSSGMTVCGVTGTNGKTTTTYLLEAVTRASGFVPGVIGTVETRVKGHPAVAALTTPEAPDLQALLAHMRDEGVEVVAMEVSSHALAYHRVDGTDFAVAIFTNLSHDHLDFHGSEDAYFEAKARLFEPERARAAAVNVDDPRGRELAARVERSGVPLVRFSGSSAHPTEEPDVVATEVDFLPDATTFVLAARRFGGTVSVRSPLVGRFNLENSLAAAAGALAAGFGLDTVAAGLETRIRVPGRFERIDRGQDFGVVVDYAHTPDALGEALRAARVVAGDRRVLVVFGCGGDRDRSKRPEMGRVAEELADLVYLTSDNPRSEDAAGIIAEIELGLTERSAVSVELDRRTAIRAALAAARSGDVVLVAGKGHETGQVIGEVVRPFDDRQVVAEALEEFSCG